MDIPFAELLNYFLKNSEERGRFLSGEPGVLSQSIALEKTKVTEWITFPVDIKGEIFTELPKGERPTFIQRRTARKALAAYYKDTAEQKASQTDKKSSSAKLVSTHKVPQGIENTHYFDNPDDKNEVLKIKQSAEKLIKKRCSASSSIKAESLESSSLRLLPLRGRELEGKMPGDSEKGVRNEGWGVKKLYLRWSLKRSLDKLYKENKH